ncbi:thiolase family protein [Marinagarivorans algicola]|uniref:thiolase family protein n=1 Tax=Marinagarivorans algicola TaxID=1513270 RepID=UPI00192E60C1|nr:thiolase family protein [Marinagarivorans algicola]
MSNTLTENQIVITALARTPIGSLQGGLASLSAAQLGGQAIKAVLGAQGAAEYGVDEVIMGCVLPAGVGQAPARQATLNGGLGVNVNATTINKVCGSGMKAVMQAADAIKAGSAEVVIAGGMESMTNAPHLLPKARAGYRLGHGEVLDHLFTDGLQDAHSGQLMGLFAEATAEKYGFTREQQDAFALESLKRANEAIANGHFSDEVAPVVVVTRKGEITVDTDELPGQARPEKIPQLKAAFKPGGTVTAANASGIGDGAAALMLMSQKKATELNHKPLARVVAYSQYAHEPEWFTTAPVGAIKRVMQKAGWSVSDVDLFEINEAFAVVTMAAIADLELPAERVNIHGGACVLGHPLGASGARIIVTLISALKTHGLKRGIASLCIGGGEAVAIAVELDD